MLDTARPDTQVEHLSLEEDERVHPGAMAEARQRVADGKVLVAEDTIAMAYSAWLGCARVHRAFVFCFLFPKGLPCEKSINLRDTGQQELMEWTSRR